MSTPRFCVVGDPKKRDDPRAGLPPVGIPIKTLPSADEQGAGGLPCAESGQSRGAIARILIEEGAVTEENLAYAERIRSKLEKDRPLRDILEELRHVDADRVKETLASRRTEVPLGELLVEFGHLAASDLAEALEIQRSSPDPKPRLGQVLVDQRFIPDRELATALSFQLDLPHREPEFKDLDRALLCRAPESWLIRHEFVPVERRAEEVVVAFTDPTDYERITAAETVFSGQRVIPAVASQGWVRGVLDLLAVGANDRGQGGADQSAAVRIRVIDDLKSEGQLPFEPSETLIRQVLDGLHAAQGYALMEQWNIPEIDGEIVRDHEKPEIDDRNLLLQIVRLVDRACNKQGIGLRGEEPVDLASRPEVTNLRVTPVLLAELEIRLEGAMELA